MQSSAVERLLNATDITQLLGVSRRTFDTLVARGETPPHILIGRQRRWRQQDVSDWIEALLADAAHRGAEGSSSSLEKGRAAT